MAIHVSEEVQEAVREGRPVVALESTIISHGMPFPQNIEMACDVELTRPTWRAGSTCGVALTR